MKGPTERQSVLLVDSDDDTRTLYANAFAAAGWIVGDAESGAIALAKALDDVPAIVVTELRLAGIGGYDLIRILRRDPDTDRVGIIVVSGDGPPESQERARAVGADLVLVKPCAPDVLVAHATALAASPEGAPAVASPLDTIRATANRPHPAYHASCPSCGSVLVYTTAHTTKVGRRTEQWLHFSCPRGCGRFEFRERTRKLRKIS